MRVDEKKRPQKAIIEFECDEGRSGLDNLWESEDQYETRKARRAEGHEKRDDDKEGGDDSKLPDLQFVRYDTSDEAEDVLRLLWKTKYACENVKDGNEDPDQKAGWGLFTWFIIM